MPIDPSRQRMAANYFRQLQDRICLTLETLDGRESFCRDEWRRAEGGGGCTQVMTEGALFEKAGVNYSEVFGELSEEFSQQIPGEGRQFTATGISLVLHPGSPMVPTVHANFRYLTKGERWWFGGGADLTPCYANREDVVHFHRCWRDVCSRHGPPVDHARFKTWCDEYFFLPHRAESRGVGGIFFDYLDGNWDELFVFVCDCGNSFLDTYIPIAERRNREAFTPEQRAFQEFRRGRYVEFNLLYDRGTVFGLKTGGRVESILMSLPPRVRWNYNWSPLPGSREAELHEVYLKPRDWANDAS